MARQIRVELSCNVLNSISQQLFSSTSFNSASTEAAYYVATSNIVNSAVPRFVKFSEFVQTCNAVTLNFVANCHSALSGYISAVGEPFGKISSDEVLVLSLAKYSAMIGKWLAFIPRVSSVNGIQVIGAVNAVNTAFPGTQSSFGFYLGFANTNQHKMLVPISQDDYTQADKMLVGLTPANASNFLIISFSPQGQAYRKIEAYLASNTQVSKILNFDAIQVFSDLRDNSNLLGTIADSQPSQRVQMILLNGPGKIDDTGIWVITKSEFEEYARETGYAFAKVLLKATDANASVHRLMLVRPGANPLENVKEFFKTYKKQEEGEKKLVWFGPSVFETSVDTLFQLDVRTYLQNAGIIDAIVSDGPGYVLNNVLYFIPREPGQFNIKLDILDLTTRQQLFVELVINAVSSEIHEKITFNIYESPGKLVKIPLELLVPRVEQADIKVVEVKQKAWLASNVVHIYNEPGAYMKLLVQSGAKNYLEIEFVSQLTV